jgi:hypothetical protein
VPHRWFIVLEIFIILVCTEGLTGWLRKREERFTRGLGIYFVVCGLLVLSGLIIFQQAWPVRAALGAGLLLSPFMLRKLRRLPTESGRSFALYGISVLMLLDIYGLALYQVPRTDPNELQPDPAAVSILKGSAGLGRYAIISTKGFLDPGLPAHLGLRIQADTISAWTRSPLARTAQVLNLIYPKLIPKQGGKIAFYDQMVLQNQKEIDPQGLRLFSLLGVNLFLSRYPWQPTGDAVQAIPRPTFQNNLFVYDNPKAMPRAFLVQQARPLAEPEQQLAALSDPAFDPFHSVILPQAQPLWEVSPLHQNAEVRCQRPAGNEINFIASAAQPAWLVLTESFAPGWELILDGRPAPLLHADYAFMAASLGTLPQGEHRGRMVYRPVSFRIGLWAGLSSFFSLVVCGILIAFFKNIIAIPKEQLQRT